MREVRVLITGGAGFIGSHLTDAFHARGDEVTVIDDLSGGQTRRVHPDVVWYKISVVQPASEITTVTRELKPDLICHLAARTGIRAGTVQAARVNVLGTVTVLEAARQAGTRVLLASSAAVYGRKGGCRASG